MVNAEIAKFNMIEQQIRPWEVLDHQVLNTLNQVNRADFVREAYKGLAYADCQIPVGNGVSMLPPTIEGRMLQALLIKPEDRVLEVGSGGGYITTCLAKLGDRVTSIDPSAEIIDFARTNVTNSGQDNVEFQQLGLAQIDFSAVYDVIAVTGSLPQVPENLKLALKPGGRMFIVVGQSPVMEALLISRVGDAEWTTQSLFETDLPRLRA
ncbi:MAG: protein-L-isoaspartate O-methyltransferase [Gammaproteobacteria bacterium]|nr:protein-L-isoaspartate O-methyltransferase [Gammaproteobacteria bacterium]MDH3856665.1 protein-L-isoaspartate O-methyltransferase [Gammaproteobacteria bacterium]